MGHQRALTERVACVRDQCNPIRVGFDERREVESFDEHDERGSRNERRRASRRKIPKIVVRAALFFSFLLYITVAVTTSRSGLEEKNAEKVKRMSNSEDDDACSGNSDTGIVFRKLTAGTSEK